MTKTQRQHRITELLEHESISTAAQLVARLHDEGVVATQATVTRDLHELGIIKVRDDQGIRRLVVPSVTKMSAPPLDHLRRMMTEWVVSVEGATNLIVLHTPPGCAHVVASALDRSVLPEVLGSVAGDDTLLVIARDERSGRRLVGQFRRLADLPVGT